MNEYWKHYFIFYRSTILLPFFFHYNTSDPGPGAAQEKFNAFFVKKKFFSCNLFRFGSLGYPGVRGRVGRVILMLKNFPDLVWKSVQNLVWIGLAVHTWKRDTGTYNQSVLYIKTNQPGPSTAQAKKILRVPIWRFYVSQSFFSPDLFWILGYPRVRGLGWQGSYLC